MIRVCHHSKTVGLGGTDKVAQIFCAELNKLPDFEAFLVYQKNGDTSRLKEAQNLIGEDKVIPYDHEHQKNPQSPYLPAKDNLQDVLATLNPDILHLHRSGYHEWPGIKSLAPRAKFVETNIFGYNDNSNVIDFYLYISHFVANRAGYRGPHSVLYNPCLSPLATRAEARPALLSRLGLDDNAILLGRVGRPDNFTPISLQAFSEVEDNHPNAHYLVVHGCNEWKRHANRLRLRNIHFIDPIISDRELSEFYAAIDIYAHARSDGETFGCSIAEAIMHGNPVVTHLGHTYQGHVEQVNDAQGDGFVGRSWQDYSAIVTRLIVDEERRSRIGETNRQWALKTVNATAVTAKLAAIYMGLTNA